MHYLIDLSIGSAYNFGIIAQNEQSSFLLDYAHHIRLVFAFDYIAVQLTAYESCLIALGLLIYLNVS